MKHPTKKGGGTLRYVVVDENGTPMMLGHYNDTPRGGVLVAGDFGMTFSRRARAIQAQLRTKQYATEHGLKWNVDKFSIHKISTAEARAR